MVFGHAGGFAASRPALSALNGANGFTLIGGADLDGAGISVSGAGDVNGDGFDDVIVGAWDASVGGGSNRTGMAYVVFGKAGGFFGNADNNEGLTQGGGGAIVSKIASVTIAGEALGTVEKGDHFGIEAEQIGSFKVGKAKLPLTAAPNEFFDVAITDDLTVRETSAVII